MTDREKELEAALAEVVTAAKRQLENTGRGIEPSERLQEAFDAAEKLLQRPTPS